MAKALYRKYRSKTLDEVVGQKHITDILKNAINSGRISHAYLFTGPRGVGKTSVARILAHEINKLPYSDESIHLDIVEIDAASNNGVEDIRDLREKVQIAPTSASKKVYIIDEVHMLSKAAFNALLKTLEEPPEHIVFILATTNIEKLPATIISRTQRFAFRPVSINEVANHLGFIAKSEGIKISKEALDIIASRGDGSFRDSISLLDQLSSISTGQEITVELVEASLGLAPNDLIKKLIEACEKHNLESIVKLLDSAQKNGVDGRIIIDQLILEIKNEIIAKPNLLPLFDKLLAINNQHTDLKLLSTLAIFSNDKKTTKNVALSVPVAEITASVAELQKPFKQANVEKKLKETTVVNEKIADIETEKVEPCDFNWEKLIENAKKNYVAIYSVLSKCGYEINDNTLTLYTMNAFYKKKLDDSKHSPLISRCLQEVGVYNLNIVTIPTAPPLKDSQAAAVAAIMGGGEEVNIEG